MLRLKRGKSGVLVAQFDLNDPHDFRRYQAFIQEGHRILKEKHYGIPGLIAPPTGGARIDFSDEGETAITHGEGGAVIPPKQMIMITYQPVNYNI